MDGGVRMCSKGKGCATRFALYSSPEGYKRVTGVKEETGPQEVDKEKSSRVPLFSHSVFRPIVGAWGTARMLPGFQSLGSWRHGRRNTGSTLDA